MHREHPAHRSTAVQSRRCSDRDSKRHRLTERRRVAKVDPWRTYSEIASSVSASLWKPARRILLLSDPVAGLLGLVLTRVLTFIIGSALRGAGERGGVTTTRPAAACANSASQKKRIEPIGISLPSLSIARYHGSVRVNCSLISLHKGLSCADHRATSLSRPARAERRRKSTSTS